LIEIKSVFSQKEEEEEDGQFEESEERNTEDVVHFVSLSLKRKEKGSLKTLFEGYQFII